MNLSELDMQILHMLEIEPTISVRKLAEKVEASWITINRHIENLESSGVLSNPIAVFNPRNLGLERHVVFFQVRDETQIQILEAMCDIHPYTHYRTRIYGPFAGVFAQFDIPPGGHSNLIRLIKSLKDQDYCIDFNELASIGNRFSTHTDLSLFDVRTLTWNYDWDRWVKTLEQSSTKVPRIPRTSRTPSLKTVDLEILRELTANAKVSQNKLQEKYGVSQSTASRKMININELFIESIRPQINRSIFDVTSTKLFYCEKASDESRGKIFNAMQSDDAPPFPMSLDFLEYGALVIWGRMPPSHEHKLYYTLWKYLHDLKVFTMDTVRGHSRLYWFYPENYDTKAKEWKEDQEWMIDAPLKALQKHVNGS